MELTEVIPWLAGGGALVVVQWGLSWALEGVAFWEGLNGKLKLFVALFLSGGVSVGATYLVLHPEVYESVAPYLSGVLMVIVGWVSQKVAHNRNPNKRG